MVGTGGGGRVQALWSFVGAVKGREVSGCSNSSKKAIGEGLNGREVVKQ